MNTLPSELIALPSYHGYFWHPTKLQLYSLKVTGTLKPLTRKKSGYYQGVYFPSGYYVSKGGRRRFFSIDDLKRLTKHDYQVPYETRSCI